MPSSGTLYIHACDGSNVTTNGYIYEYSNQLYNVNIYGTKNTFQYFEGRKAVWGNGVITSEPSNGANNFNNLIVRYFGETGIGATGGSSVVDNIMIDGYLPSETTIGGSGLMIYEDAGATGLTSTVKR